MILLLRNIKDSGWQAVKFAVRSLPRDADAGTIKETIELIANKVKEDSKIEEQTYQLKVNDFLYNLLL